MKTLFESSVREEIINRINSLTSENNAQWGTMNVSQMLKHCTLCDDMFFGKINIKRVFIGRLIGPMLLKKALQDDRGFGKNSPTSPLLKTNNEVCDLAVQKKEWTLSIEQFADFNNNNFVHPFFGPMNKEQIGLFAYKHADHHLRQFGA
ncbi:DUF1569 domain-containing protein [Lacibacter luteus]|uniref:DUF1569 domain-containing protein n=1 Tax=Lacibacter luteus TaxID=2508719 RepID=A0A4Q1CPX9_9BACT|nr:DUF1569 domain-containing protein [Lacibacter luteus]RXK62791.1 DUF1569 domain-containing protein [Lacibacter luteus]